MANAMVLIMDINFLIRARGEAGKLGGSCSSQAERPVPPEECGKLPASLLYRSMSKNISHSKQDAMCGTSFTHLQERSSVDASVS